MKKKQKLVIAIIGEGERLERKTHVYFKGTGNILFSKLSCGYILMIISFLYKHTILYMGNIL